MISGVIVIQYMQKDSLAVCVVHLCTCALCMFTQVSCTILRFFSQMDFVSHYGFFFSLWVFSMRCVNPPPKVYSLPFSPLPALHVVNVLFVICFCIDVVLTELCCFLVW